MTDYFVKCDSPECRNCIHNHKMFSGFTLNAYKTRRSFRNDKLKLNFKIREYTYRNGSIWCHGVGVFIEGSINGEGLISYFCKQDQDWIKLQASDKIAHIKREIERKYKNGTYPLRIR